MMRIENGREIKVWDPLVRLFHWALVAACVAAYLTQAQHYRLHLQAGYLVMGLVCFRVVWGFVGTAHARFRDFLFRPASVLAYLRDMLRGQAPRYLGHNPAGGVMILALLLALALITFSGVALDAAENRAGPLAQTRLFLYTDVIARVHELATHAATLLVALHVAGVLLSSRRHGENLVRAMITGRKRA